MVKPVATKEHANNVKSTEYLHRAARGPSSSLTSSPALQAAHQFCGSDFCGGAVRSTLGSRPSIVANNRSPGFDCRTSDWESVDKEALAGMVK